MSGVEERLERIEDVLLKIDQKISFIKCKLETGKTLIKWVIFPLLIILGALIGLKLYLPT